MDIAILLQMSALINHHSVRFEAVVPNAPVTYLKQVHSNLVATKCRALKVTIRGKHKNHLHQAVWTIYETDIDKVIRQISRHNPEFAERARTIALTPQDVDIIVRRASYKTLRLQLIPSAFFVSGNGKT